MNENRNSGQKPPRGVSVAAAKRRHKHRRMKNRFFALCMTLILVAAVGFALFDRLFVIQSFSVKGAGEYTEADAEAMAKAVGLEKGMHLFGFDRAAAMQTAKYALSAFDSVVIRYDLPNGIVFEVKEAVPALYTSVGGTNFILSEGLRVLSMTNNAAEVEALALKRAYIGGVTSCVAGEFVKTSNGCDEILKQLYAVLKEEGCVGEADELDVSGKFDISFLYKQRFTVKLGDADNLTVKVRFMKSIVDKLSDTDSGIIDVSDENYREGVFKSY